MHHIKGIILAHGLNGEIGVPYNVRKSRLPWPRLAGDLDHLKSTIRDSVLLLGKTSYFAAADYLANDSTAVLGIGHGLTQLILPSIEDAVKYANEQYPDRDIWIGGGAKLADAGFKLLEVQGHGEFHETVVDQTFEEADAHMPSFNENLWSEPRVIASFDPGVVVGHTTVEGRSLPEVRPGYRIQVREVLPKAV